MSRKLSEKRRLERTSIGIGFLGVGKYSSRINKVCTPEFRTWYNMLNRCYNKKEIERNPSYKGCEVHDDWHNFQNFAKWYNSNIPNALVKYQLDKDILLKGNKIYSPETCCFITPELNTILTNSHLKRGLYPVGVSLNNKRFQSSCNVNKKRIYIGIYDTPEQAFTAYKAFKENIIYVAAKDLFDKNHITNNVYESILKYKILITD